MKRNISGLDCSALGRHRRPVPAAALRNHPLVNAHPIQFPNGPVTLATSWHETVLGLIVLAVVASAAALLPAWRAVQIRVLDDIWGT